MNERLIKNWNSRVKSEDTVIFLGDFCFRNSPGGKDGEGDSNKAEFYKNMLHGEIVFVRGNHDGNNSLNTKIKSLVMDLGGMEVFCIHDPAYANLRYRINLCGHVHQNWKFQKVGKTIIVNVGVDVWNYMPVTFDEILKELKKQYPKWRL